MDIEKCQVAAQKQLGCNEHIVTLRLMCDYAMYEKRKLYVFFIDFSKASDRVPRDKLMESLKHLWCGKLMVKAICAIFTCTKNILKLTVIDSFIGVRKGAPTSPFLCFVY